MFLHSGASLHGHEYSSKGAAQQQTPKRSTLLRSTFTPKTRPISLDGAVRQLPSIPESRKRPASDFIPRARAAEPVVQLLEPLDSEDDDLPTPMTEDHVSVSESEFSDASAAGTLETPRRKRSRKPRTATTYALAYPAPSFAGKSRNRMVKKVAPKLFLQLQQVSDDHRPKPIIDVFPSARIAGPVIAPRLAKRFPRLFGPKGELASSDVVLMRCEDYEKTSEDADSEDEERGMEKRQPVAVISPVKKLGRTEIVLEDGSVWVAKPLPTGSFDFVHVNSHGITTTARWVRRSSRRSGSLRASDESASKSSRATVSPSDGTYIFSIVNPLSRRHPVMATLTPAFLSIQDTYTSVSTSSGRYPPSKPLSRANTMTVPHRPSPLRPTSVRSLSMNAADDDSDNGAAIPGPEGKRTTHDVDEATKLLISVTSVWIALQSGWSPFYTAPSCVVEHGPESVTSASVTNSSQLGRKGTRSRGNSMEITNLPPPHAGPTGIRSREHSPVRSFSLGTLPPPWWETRTTSSPVTPPVAAMKTPILDPGSPVPQRATSTGAAYMTRTRIVSINKADEEPDTDAKHCRRILSGGGGRTMVRHSIGATPPSPQETITIDDVKRDVNDQENFVHSRSYSVRIPQGARQDQSPRLPRSVKFAAQPTIVQNVPVNVALVPHPLMTVPEVPVAVVQDVTRPKPTFGSKMKNIGHWFRKLGAHTGMH